MKGDAVRLAQLSAQIQTAGAAMGCLDAASNQLDLASAAVDAIPAGYAMKDPVAAGIAFLFGSTQDVQATLRDSIEQARDEIAKYRSAFNGYVGDDLAQEISTAHSMGIASTLQYCNKTLNTCIDEIGDGPTISVIDLVAAVAKVLQTVVTVAQQAAQSVVQAAANTTAGIVSAFWVPLVVVGGALALIVAWQKGLLSK